jgi:hypothetical protein
MTVRHTSARKPVPYASAAEALTFKHNRNRQPEVIAARLSNEIGCDCAPYHDILTIGRWRALGALVRKGEHAVAHGGKNKTIPLFCHCQIEFKTEALPETDCSGGIPGFEGIDQGTTEPEPEPIPEPIPEPDEPPYTSAGKLAAIRAQMAELRLILDTRMDGTPNLRDYGYERFEEFQSDVEHYHAATREMWDALNGLSIEFQRLRQEQAPS